MNKEDKVKRILTTTGYMPQVEKTIVYLYIEELQAKVNQLETNRDEVIELLKSKNNGKCITNGKEKNAYTFVLDFDKAREFIWELEEILERGKE